MKVGIIGTRGIPAKYGGFETFAEEISVLLAKDDVNVTVYCDKPSTKEVEDHYKNVSLKYLRCRKSVSPLFYYFQSLKKALQENDIVIVTGTGGSFFYFLTLWKHKIIITNTDGLESSRAKWSKSKKCFIKLSEILAIKFSDHLVADAKGISDYLLDNYPSLQKSKLSTIEYGASINTTLIPEYLTKHRLKKDDYFLVVSRLEPENNLQMILDGYNSSSDSKPLIIIGNLIDNPYVKSLLKSQSEKIRFIGGVYNKEELCTLRTGAYAYIHGHSVGGTNPSLLEALGSSNICICHDNIFNREVTASKQLYFSTANELRSRIEELENLDEKQIIKIKNDALYQIKSYYNWENIATKYFSLLKKYEKNNA
jgi:glycosyltransferase involved in cell wall biosynthesis